MKHLTRAMLVVSALALAACSQSERFDNDVALGGTAGADGAVVPGSANDPTSPLYFQSAVGDRVLFAVDQSTLSDEARATLNAQAQWLMTNSDYTAVIEGHADEQGTREYNLALGARRANAAREYLITQGVAASRLKTVTYGKERPIEICSTESCYAKNRRAVTVLAAGAIS
ncbi:peptidoglycan-associated lipoprotein [Pseudooceanicola batsensis HTCC2597]|uniref:Peptidoglycan-associated lipoprotein n=1 Tax=Pseudooceanicola batsensis (strain ATCC BAA-863 / DSM 15984 / KCTC 12145 / HTCC2597) TaxID=252305 RepID=A3TZ15_PSEBH|nr:peptidoglycan-associated lipoprotein Pal [Pseudooceanicola batsensis]EAQ02833.1 peptidoglycan-associated lipoprotein [Pseudooceanicola batsensis HTCC2597]